MQRGDHPPLPRRRGRRGRPAAVLSDLPVLVEVVRSGFVEGAHRGSVVALRPDGSRALSLGDPDRPVLPRSSNKPLQAVGLLRAGWRPRSAGELALACASHSGEPVHVEAVLAMLGGDPSDLRTPVMLPLDEDEAARLRASGSPGTPVTMNCSGKHAAMLLACDARGWPREGYLDPVHPLQQALTAAVEDLAGERVAHVAVDGCGAPQHALSLTGLARAFARLATAAPGSDEHAVASAVRAHPRLLGGTGRDVTLLVEGVPGLVAKDGAEGVYAAALPDGSAVALKVEDGAARARPPVLVAALRALGVDAPVLEGLARTPLLGGGRVVGELRPAAVLT